MDLGIVFFQRGEALSKGPGMLFFNANPLHQDKLPINEIWSGLDEPGGLSRHGAS